MPAEILIVGQGLAGTLLGFAFEGAGIPFAIADRGHATAATRVAAGLINPITGRRLVKSWRVDELLPLARERYRAIETRLETRLWTDVRIRRLFADEAERRAFAAKFVRGEFAPYVSEPADETGFWIEGAVRVDLGELLRAAREYWRSRGRLREAEIDVVAEATRHELVIDCTGLAGTRAHGDLAPWEFSKGEVLEIATEGLAAEIVFNRRHAIVPLADDRAWVGATHEPGNIDATTTAAARESLEATARYLLARPFQIREQRAAIRVNLPDRRPLAGRHPTNPRIGFVNALGAKGALLAPWLARQWVDHLTRGVRFDAEIGRERFSDCNSSQASSR